MTDLQKAHKRTTKKQAELHAIQRFLNTEDGQTFTNYLIRTYVIPTSFVPSDPASTAYKNGQRDLVLQIVGAAHKPDVFASELQLIMTELEHQRIED
jgi:hypothetical protein